MIPSGPVALVEATRSTQGEEHAECVHYGSVAVVDAHGTLVHFAGDPGYPTFTRSTIKPFQALPFMQDGGPGHFGFAPEQVAMMCASHSAEEEHVGQVDRMLELIGCEESQLACGAHVPLSYAAMERSAAPGATFDQRHNNCSGKHCGFLGYCKLHGLPLQGYLDEGHPLQTRIRRTLGEFLQHPPEQLKVGTDGCSAPNYNMPLHRLAYGYARLAQGAGDLRDGQLLAPLFDAMTSNPVLVSGHGRHDLSFMRAAPGDWVAKVGADGVQAIGIRSRGIGIAIKIADGSPRALPVAAVGVLGELGLLDATAMQALQGWSEPVLRNARGRQTGRLRYVGSLRAA